MARAKRICPRPGCPRPAVGRYCPEHNKEYDRSRGTATARGYGAAHRRARAEWDTRVQRGGICCQRCGGPITPGEPWHLDHDDDRSRYRGPACAPCNLRLAGLARHGISPDG